MFTVIEILSVICGVLFLVLIIKERIAGWLFGILGSALTVVLFIEHKLYLEAGLNFYYVLAGIYGWVFWRKSGQHGKKTPVITWRPGDHAAALLSGALLTVVLGFLMRSYTDSPRPYFDAGLTVFSFIATYSEARKVLSTWHYWFLINGMAVWLQIDRGIYFYAGLSVFYTVMCVLGYKQWKKTYKQQELQ